VLVVDHDSAARALLRSILERCGAEITEISSAAEALETLEMLRPDIVVSDICMPIEDGYAFIREVRAREIKEQAARIPALALIARAEKEDRLRALSAGYQAYVAKPVEPAELIAIIASLAFPKV
jgi:CheY-like chemotaxis protein